MNARRMLCSFRLTRRAWRAVQVVLMVLVLIGAAWPAHPPALAGDVPAAAPSPGQTPLAELLDARAASPRPGSEGSSNW